jgi:hypothetical protein
MATHKKDINLLAVMTNKTSRVNPLVIVVPIVVFVLLGALIMLSTFRYATTVATLVAERDSLQLYLDSTRVEDSTEKAEEYKALATDMEQRASGVKNTLYNLSSYPDLYGEHFDIIFELAGEDITLADYAYNRRTGVLSFSATSPSVRQMPHFVQGLRDCGYFADIQYRGYVRGTHTESGEPTIDPVTEITTIPSITVIEYRYEITCKLASPSPALPPVEGEDEGEGAEGEGDAAEGDAAEGDGAQEGGS